MRVDLIIKGEIDSKKLYNELREYEPLVENLCVTDITKETYVSASVNLDETDVDRIVRTCRKYGPCDVDAEVLPIIIK